MNIQSIQFLILLGSLIIGVLEIVRRLTEVKNQLTSLKKEISDIKTIKINPNKNILHG